MFRKLPAQLAATEQNFTEQANAIALHLKKIINP